MTTLQTIPDLPHQSLAAPVNTPPKQNTISLRTENSTRPRGNSDNETDLPKAIPVEKSLRYSTEYKKITKKGDPKFSRWKCG